MANVAIYNMEGNEVGSLELNDAVFGVEIKEPVMPDRAPSALLSGKAAA